MMKGLFPKVVVVHFLNYSLLIAVCFTPLLSVYSFIPGQLYVPMWIDLFMHKNTPKGQES